ncbi:PKD domain-containing protein [Candidatus Nitrosocosmicus hydrocola]|uniref:PKD domain-containing protein n=1 Tax=Candidatus Nitrosocosmicus hydrocola TaxID=1826872 RepID=UPI0011E5EE70|nr:hypothetical protein [Candidatus Nitrosocosmicus hydrocola]
MKTILPLHQLLLKKRHQDSDSESEDNSTSSSSPTEDRIPVADAGPDVTVQSQTLTQLDGGNSNGPNTSGDDVSPSLNYDWTQTAGPEVALNNPNTANPDFISPETQEETQLTFQLIVSTDSATSDPDSVTVSVTPSVIPQTPETPTDQPEPQTPGLVEFQTVTETCNTTNDLYNQGSLTIATDQSFSQIYKITPNPYGSEDSLYFVDNDFFDCTTDNSLISLDGLNFGWYQIEIFDENNSDNNKVFDISINPDLPYPVIYLFEKTFEPNLNYEPIASQYIVWLDENITSDAIAVSEDYSQNGKIIHIFENPPGFAINMYGSGIPNEKDFVSKLASDPRIFAINQDLYGKSRIFKI